MFLNEAHVSKTFIREDIASSGLNESILVVEMDDTPDHLKEVEPKTYQRLSEKLAYLNNLAQNGFLDFNRIEIITNQTRH